MTEEATPETFGPPAVSKMNITVNMAIAGPKPIWIVKVGDGYLRASTMSHIMVVSNLRLATRWDSPTWAATVSSGFDKARVVRLLTKSEREILAARKVKASTWTWTAPVSVETEATQTGRPDSNG